MASNRIVGITIDIEGRNDGITKSLQQVQKESQQTSSALKSIDSALKEVTDEAQRVELLAQKEELLTKQIEQTNEKLEIMRKVAEDAKKGLEDGTVTKEQYAILTSEIAKTEQTLEQLGAAASETSNELAGIDSGDLDSVGDDAETASDGLEDVQEESEETNRSFDALGKGAAAVGAAMVAATAAMVDALKEVGGALVDCTMDAAAYSDELLTQSTVTGLSTDKLQELGYAADLVDTSVDTITGSMTKNLKAMNSAREGTGAAAEAYAKLGVSVTNADGSLRDQEEVYWEVIDALGNVSNETERDALAMDILGRSAKELNPLIEAGSETMASLAEEAHETGYVMSDEMLGAFGEFDDQMVRFKNSGQAAKNALGTLLLPALSELSGTGTSALQKFTKAVQSSNGDVSVIGDAISEMLPDVLASVNKVLPDLLKLVATGVDTLLQVLIDNLPLFVDTAIQIIEQLTTTLINPENIAKIMDAAVTIVLSLVEFILQNMDMIISSAIQIVLAIVNGISQALPELIPAAVDAILTICETLLAPENLSMILEAALNLVIGLAMGIVDSLPQIIERLPEIISGIVTWLLSEDGLGQIVEAGFQLFIGLVTKMPDIIVELIGALGDLLFDLVEYISGDMFTDITEAFSGIFDDIISDAFTWGADILQNICDGFASMWDTFTGWIDDIASGISDFLGFSCPEKGPLSDWDVNNPGKDMLQLYGSGIQAGIPGLMDDINLAANAIKTSVNNDFDITGATLDNTMNVIAAGTRDYSDQLGQINGSLSVMAGGDRQVVIPVYIGQERIETIVASANVNNNFISGGR